MTTNDELITALVNVVQELALKILPPEEREGVVLGPDTPAPVVAERLTELLGRIWERCDPAALEALAGEARKEGET